MSFISESGHVRNPALALGQGWATPERESALRLLHVPPKLL